MGLFERWRPSSGAGHQDSAEQHRLGDTDTGDPLLDDTVRAHVERLTAAMDADADTLSPQELEAAVTARLVGQDTLPPGDPDYHYLSPFSEHVAEVLTLDLPSAVVTLTGTRVGSHGRSVAALATIGRRNLRRLMEDAEVDVVRLDGRGGSCTALLGDSPYTASFARFLGEAVQRWVPDADNGNGIVFALPHRHGIVLQTCEDAAGTAEALEQVPARAREMFASSLGPISPHVYHWYHREITCLTTGLPDGTLSLSTTPLLDGMLGRRTSRAG